VCLEVIFGHIADQYADMFGGPLFYHLTVLALVEPNMPDDVPDLLTQAILRGIARQET
jgi:hypothetical protein